MHLHKQARTQTCWYIHTARIRHLYQACVRHNLSDKRIYSHSFNLNFFFLFFKQIKSILSEWQLDPIFAFNVFIRCCIFSDGDVCVLKGNVCVFKAEWCLYKCFCPFPQCRPRYESISAATLCLRGYSASDFWEFITAVKCILLPDSTCVCVCVSAWICISDCSMQFWPLAIQPLLILNRIFSPHSSLATVPPTFTTPYWHPEAQGGTASTWCSADSEGDGELLTSGICP